MLPSDLYLHTNEQLSSIYEGLTGKVAPPRTSKATLVARIERNSGGATKGISKTKAAIKPAKRGLLPTLSSTQLAEMKRVLKAPAADFELRHSHSELAKIWARMGMKAQYPHRSSKELVVGRLRTFASNNLEYHSM